MNHTTGALRYRIGQFLRAVTARTWETETGLAARVLTPASLDLFRAMSVQDQRHGLDVYASLCRAGHTDPHLLAAALLHDVGKAAARLPAWQRALIVLLERFAPRLLARLSRWEPSEYGPGSVADLAPALPPGWRRPFIVHVCHPEIGARWAREAGCSPLTVALIRQHHDPAETGTDGEQFLVALQAADSTN
ncbi:MAG TPA: hypothetical protein ENN99_05000 [Chloroflexi bacterium]|nr:hypothetical protein [Chloroflexota bacterium]